MQHLAIETLARLADEAPDEVEAAHIEQCDECRHILEAMRADLAALADLPMIEPPPTEWVELEERLLEEGLIRRRPAAHSIWTKGVVRAAASAAIFALGTLAGAGWTRGDEARVLPFETSFAGVETSSTASSRVPLVAVREPRSAEETLALYRQAEAVWLDALDRASALQSTESADPVARIAALSAIAAITRSALEEAPADPVLNGYHLTALAQREATVRQMAASGNGRWF
ncbi:MAG: hypothetical protein ACREL7_04640 [Longimicrobiales bacterium]